MWHAGDTRSTLKKVATKCEGKSIVCATHFQLAEALRWPNVGPLEGQGHPPSQLSMCKTAIGFDVALYRSLCHEQQKHLPKSHLAGHTVEGQNPAPTMIEYVKNPPTPPNLILSSGHAARQSTEALAILSAGVKGGWDR